jgi:hypothetical protein
MKPTNFVYTDAIDDEYTYTSGNLTKESMYNVLKTKPGFAGSTDDI